MTEKQPSPEEIVRRTIAVLRDFNRNAYENKKHIWRTLAREGKTTHEEVFDRAVELKDGLLEDELERLESRADLIIGETGRLALDRLVREERAAALISVSNQIVEHMGTLEKAISLSGEMGWNMLSQKGMMSAFHWSSRFLIQIAAGLAPDMKVGTITLKDLMESADASEQQEGK